MELREALSQISEIRQQMARSEIFQGYRSVSVAITGVLGIVAACLQPVFIPSPVQQIDRYLALWIGLAVIGLTLAGIQLIRRAQFAGPGVSRELTRLAVEQFLPCILVGGLVTLCLYIGPREARWALPGLWSLFFALGIFSSYRLLPPRSSGRDFTISSVAVAASFWGMVSRHSRLGKWASVSAAVSC